MQDLHALKENDRRKREEYLRALWATEQPISEEEIEIVKKQLLDLSEGCGGSKDKRIETYQYHAARLLQALAARKSGADRPDHPFGE